MRIATSAKATPPLLLLQHFRGNLDNWDPALIEALAPIGGSWRSTTSASADRPGRTPSTITQMALDAIAFLEAMGFDQVDVLGFSIGSFVAQGSR